MIGTFNHHKNCSVVHHIPQGATHDGLPVIVFPKGNFTVTLGQTYEFEAIMTRRAIYIIDGQKYRVAHAVGLIQINGREGDDVDAILYKPATPRRAKLGDVIGAEVVDKLAALRARLVP